MAPYLLLYVSEVCKILNPSILLGLQLSYQRFNRMLVIEFLLPVSTLLFSYPCFTFLFNTLNGLMSLNDIVGDRPFKVVEEGTI